MVKYFCNHCKKETNNRTFREARTTIINDEERVTFSLIEDLCAGCQEKFTKMIKAWEGGE